MISCHANCGLSALDVHMITMVAAQCVTMDMEKAFILSRS